MDIKRIEAELAKKRNKLNDLSNRLDIQGQRVRKELDEALKKKSQNQHSKRSRKISMSFE